MSDLPVSLLDMRQALSRREVSARELLDGCIAHITATDDRINAFTRRTLERAYGEADAADAVLRRASPEQRSLLPPLLGIPYAVKNLFDVAGEVTLAGSRLHRSRPPASTDAVLVTRLRDAGAVLVGMLNMDEFAYGFTTENSHYGACHNPHDTTRVAGGSSGGSAAAIAAGQVPLTLASDTNGSIRVPSSLCGVWGLKPTFGRLSCRGTYPFVASLDHLGPLSDSVEGLALAYDALQGADPEDPACLARHTQPVLPHLAVADQRPLRVAVLDGYFQEFAGPAARAAVASAAQVLGAADAVTWPDAAVARAAAFIITASEGGALHLESLRTRRDEFEPLSVDRFISGVVQPAAWSVRAHRFRSMNRARVLALFEQWDVLLAPATPVVAPLIGSEWIDINEQRLPCRPSLGLLTQPISFVGCPVISAPFWPSQGNGLPMGVQLIAAPWREDLAFRAAQILQLSGLAHVNLNSHLIEPDADRRQQAATTGHVTHG